MIQTFLTLKEAAELAGVSKVTLWRLVQRGALEAVIDERKRYTISREVLQKWMETFQGDSKRFIVTPNEEVASEAEAFQFQSNGLKRFGETLHEAIETPCSGEAFQGETVEMVSADLHRVALESTRCALECARRAEERAGLAERRLESLGGQLLQYQNILSERSESLAEKEALCRAAETLATENAQRMEQFEAEKADLLEKLRMSQSRVEWIERRVPRWVRALFRAG